MNRIGRLDVRQAMTRILVVTVILGLLVACDPAEPQQMGSLLVIATAGPVCPVQSEPPNPSCAPRPVAGASVVVTQTNDEGTVVAQGETGADGRLTLDVPAGDYVVTAGEVEGLITTSE